MALSAAGVKCLATLAYPGLSTFALALLTHPPLYPPATQDAYPLLREALDLLHDGDQTMNDHSGATALVTNLQRRWGVVWEGLQANVRHALSKGKEGRANTGGAHTSITPRDVLTWLESVAVFPDGWAHTATDTRWSCRGPLAAVLYDAVLDVWQEEHPGEEPWSSPYLPTTMFDVDLAKVLPFIPGDNDTDTTPRPALFCTPEYNGKAIVFMQPSVLDQLSIRERLALVTAHTKDVYSITDLQRLAAALAHICPGMVTGGLSSIVHVPDEHAQWSHTHVLQHRAVLASQPLLARDVTDAIVRAVSSLPLYIPSTAAGPTRETTTTSKATTDQENHDAVETRVLIEYIMVRCLEGAYSLGLGAEVEAVVGLDSDKGFVTELRDVHASIVFHRDMLRWAARGYHPALHTPACHFDHTVTALSRTVDRQVGTALIEVMYHHDRVFVRSPAGEVRLDGTIHLTLDHN